jgi:hypothetical protein
MARQHDFGFAILDFGLSYAQSKIQNLERALDTRDRATLTDIKACTIGEFLADFRL